MSNWAFQKLTTRSSRTTSEKDELTYCSNFGFQKFWAWCYKFDVLWVPFYCNTKCRMAKDVNFGTLNNFRKSNAVIEKYVHNAERNKSYDQQKDQIIVKTTFWYVRIYRYSNFLIFLLRDLVGNAPLQTQKPKGITNKIVCRLIW